MEYSGYRVEILGGRHFSKDHMRNDYDEPTSLFSSHFPWKPFRDFSGGHKNYVEMMNGDQYKLKLRNNHGQRCQAKVKIDGRHVGTWVVPAYDTIVIERPADVDKKFTFYRVSKAPIGSGIVSDRANNGLVEVEFTPERYDAWRVEYDCHDCMPQHLSCNSYSKGLSPNESFGQQHRGHPQQMNCMAGQFSESHEQGATALRGRSYQKFRRTGPLDLDHSKQVTVTVRLVGRKRRRSFDYDSVTPLGHKKSPVPPPISQWDSPRQPYWRSSILHNFV